MSIPIDSLRTVLRKSGKSDPPQKFKNLERPLHIEGVSSSSSHIRAVGEVHVSEVVSPQTRTDHDDGKWMTVTTTMTQSFRLWRSFTRFATHQNAIASRRPVQSLSLSAGYQSISQLVIVIPNLIQISGPVSGKLQQCPIAHSL